MNEEIKESEKIYQEIEILKIERAFIDGQINILSKFLIKALRKETKEEEQ